VAQNPQASAKSVQPGERNGYIVWGLATVFAVVPEIFAAASKQSPWPTISSTIGHLEYSASWVALIVVAVIVFVGYNLLTQMSRTAPLKARGTYGRRLGKLPLLKAQSKKDLPQLAVVVSPLLVLVGGLLTAKAAPDDKFVMGYVVSSLAATCFVLLPSAVAYVAKRDTPFAPFFTTVRYLERRASWTGIVVAIGLVILLIHLALFPWPGVFHQLQSPTPSSP
jgi:hypothetical protein